MGLFSRNSSNDGKWLSNEPSSRRADVPSSTPPAPTRSSRPTKATRLTTAELHASAASMGGEAEVGRHYASIDIRKGNRVDSIRYHRKDDGTWSPIGW